MNEPEARPAPGRWTVIRDTAAFQVKLVVDGLRDAALIPISLAAAVFGILFSRRAPGEYFYELLRLGQRSERWIDLFGAARHAEAGDENRATIDELIGRIERRVREEHAKGGATAAARRAVDGAVDRLQRMTRRDPEGPDR